MTGIWNDKWNWNVTNEYQVEKQSVDNFNNWSITGINVKNDKCGRIWFFLLFSSLRKRNSQNKLNMLKIFKYQLILNIDIHTKITHSWLQIPFMYFINLTLSCFYIFLTCSQKMRITGATFGKYFLKFICVNLYKNRNPKDLILILRKHSKKTFLGILLLIGVLMS